MSYFPAFLTLENKKILIIGGGYIAHEKLLHLLDFSQDIHIIALEYSDDMSRTIGENNLHFEKRSYETGDIKNFSIVIVAVDDMLLQEKIFNESKNSNCLCNSVDSVKYCDFIFPSYIKKDDLTIAISTSGASPAMAKHLRMFIQRLIPSGINEFLKEMKELRKTLPKGKERMELLDKKAEKYIRDFEKN